MANVTKCNAKNFFHQFLYKYESQPFEKNLPLFELRQKEHPLAQTHRCGAQSCDAGKAETLHLLFG